MISNLKEFEAGLAKAIAKVDDRVADHVRYAAIEGARQIIKNTPVDTGTARGNWQQTVGKPASGILPPDPSGDQTLAKAIATVMSSDPYNIFFLANNVAHIEILEFGLFDPPNPGPSKDHRKGRKGRVLVKNGYSTQAPQGMVRLAYQSVIAGLAAGVP